VDVLADLDARGLIQETTDHAALAARLAEGPITLYYGCDPSADSLHVGNLIGLLVLRRFQLAGHRPIALAGGATGMIGDPGGRSEERNLLDPDTLARNVEAITGQISRILGSEAGSGTPASQGGGAWELVDNMSWTRDVRLLDFLRDVGKHVTVNQMVARESVRARMASEHGISYTEFSYMLLQAHDYLWLHDNRGCELQIGGSDQWGNLLSGVDLVRRTRGAAVHALAWPLILADDGTKLGKTTGARTWLDADRTSPFDLYQHFLRSPDAEVRRNLAWLTLLPIDEVDAIAAAHAEAPDAREGQRVLAREVTRLVHGDAALAPVEEATAVLYGGADPAVLSEGALEVVARTLGAWRAPASAVLADPEGLVTALVETGLAGGRKEARRFLEQGAVQVNGTPQPAGASLGAPDLLAGRFVVLRRGKKTFGVVQVDDLPGHR
jgi:tyrosyl-tRNA synthetase